MSLDAIQIEINSVTSEISRCRLDLTEVRARLRSLRLDAINASLGRVYYRAILAFDRVAAKINLSKFGFVLFFPLILGVFAFVLADVLASDRLLSGILGVMIALIAAANSYAVVLKVPPDVARLRLEHASRRRAELKPEIADAEIQKKSINEYLKSASQRQKELLTRKQQIERAQSVQHQRKRLLQRNWRAMRGTDLEHYLAEVLTLLGFKVELTKTTGDQGVDLIATRGSFRVAIQVKGYHNSVGNEAVQQAFSGKEFYQCGYCAVITNSRFTSSAVQLAERTRCILVHEDNFRDFVMGRVDLFGGKSVDSRG